MKKLTRNVLLLAGLGFACCSLPASADAAETRIRLSFGAEQAVAVLDDIPASRDFAAMLPLTLEFEDYNSTEKISMLPKKLKTAGSPTSCTPQRGAFTYYAPWGNLAIFHRNFRHSNGLVPLGRVVSGMDALAAIRDGTKITIEEIR
ncbi:MAG: cyclophilin-like fold protein [Desulfovibrionaceae bacterium]|nr:cyclophilin-like fold protein [Desulfovibrionaceae bacterium]